MTRISMRPRPIVRDRGVRADLQACGARAAGGLDPQRHANGRRHAPVTHSLACDYMKPLLITALALATVGISANLDRTVSWWREGRSAATHGSSSSQRDDGSVTA